MMKYGKNLVAIVAIGLAALTFAPVAMAADDVDADSDGGPRLGLFAGLDFGFAGHDGDGLTLDDTDEATWGINAWFRPSRFGAVQMGYAELNDDLNGFHAKAMPMYPLGICGLSIFGSIGVLVETGKEASSGTGGTARNDRDNWLTYGGGVIWDDLSIGGVENFGLRLDYERLDENNEGDNTVDRITVGFFYRFGKMGDK